MPLALFFNLSSIFFTFSRSVICSRYRDALERVKGLQAAIFCSSLRKNVGYCENRCTHARQNWPEWARFGVPNDLERLFLLCGAQLVMMWYLQSVTDAGELNLVVSKQCEPEFCLHSCAIFVGPWKRHGSWKERYILQATRMSQELLATLIENSTFLHFHNEKH